ncbi:MAG: hypothetical protein CMK09_08895 [Ponticaulis sp.]|nr:hypothetical protein [Ponticaulis sp.]|tara:strand:- start:3749 stop:4207 length:459 start_codon:yes stop_codon:yes gene_type:complete
MLGEYHHFKVKLLAAAAVSFLAGPAGNAFAQSEPSTGAPLSASEEGTESELTFEESVDALVSDIRAAVAELDEDADLLTIEAEIVRVLQESEFDEAVQLAALEVLQLDTNAILAEAAANVADIIDSGIGGIPGPGDAFAEASPLVSTDGADY